MSTDVIHLLSRRDRSRAWLCSGPGSPRAPSPLAEIARLRSELDAARRRLDHGASSTISGAQEVARVSAALGWPSSRLANRLGVDEDTVAAWFRKAAVDDGARFNGGSRAQQLARIRDVCGWTTDETAAHLGSSVAAVERWMRKARADASGAIDKGGREPSADTLSRAAALAAGAEPDRSIVLHLRALAVLSVACPDAIPELQTRGRFARTLGSVERVRLSWMPDPVLDAVVVDGADVDDEEHEDA